MTEFGREFRPHILSTKNIICSVSNNSTQCSTSTVLRISRWIKLLQIVANKIFMAIDGRLRTFIYVPDVVPCVDNTISSQRKIVWLPVFTNFLQNQININVLLSSEYRTLCYWSTKLLKMSGIGGVFLKIEVVFVSLFTVSVLYHSHRFVFQQVRTSPHPATHRERWLLGHYIEF